MLIFTRRTGETIIIQLPTGEIIKLVVQRIRGQEIRIGTKAPREIPISRPK